MGSPNPPRGAQTLPGEPKPSLGSPNPPWGAPSPLKQSPHCRVPLGTVGGGGFLSVLEKTPAPRQENKDKAVPASPSKASPGPAGHRVLAKTGTSAAARPRCHHIRAGTAGFGCGAGTPGPARGDKTLPALRKPQRGPQRAPGAEAGKAGWEMNPGRVGAGDSAEEPFPGPWAALSMRCSRLCATLSVLGKARGARVVCRAHAALVTSVPAPWWHRGGRGHPCHRGRAWRVPGVPG